MINQAILKLILLSVETNFNGVENKITKYIKLVISIATFANNIGIICSAAKNANKNKNGANLWTIL